MEHLEINLEIPQNWDIPVIPAACLTLNECLKFILVQIILSPYTAKNIHRLSGITSKYTPINLQMQFK